MTIFERALEFVPPGSAIGLGSGRAASAFIKALGDRVRAGFDVRGVPASEESATLARQVGIALVSLEEAMPLPVTVDGADEVDPHLNLIKGYGRALVREKIVAAASKHLVILIGPDGVREKLVPVLGTRGKLPVEVVAFGQPLVRSKLEEMGIASGPMIGYDGQPAVSDNGNPILECRVGPITDPAELD